MSESLEEMIRHEGGRVLATLVRLVGNIDIAEDAVQDAVVDALRRWPVDGVPSNPAAWLTTAARNRALDVLRRELKRSAKESDARLLDEMSLALSEITSDSMVRDDLLRLLFTCCHPAIAAESRLALALRTLCGMTTSEIASVFLVPEPTMGQRISRAKKKPVVRVNRAVAVAHAQDAAAGLALLDQVDIDMSGVESWHLYWGTRGELLARSGSWAAATDAYDRALDCVPNDSDREFLLKRRDAVASERREAS